MSRIADWFTTRWPFKEVTRWGLDEKIPGGSSFAYVLGSSTLFVLLLQVITGVWQLFFYVPTTDGAYQSVMYIRQEVPYGWLIHGLHYWGSSALIVLVSLHMARVFIWGAYKRPREFTWILGVILFLLVLMESFTGALLAWDELGYWAAEVGTSIAGTVPWIGHWMKEVMRGGAAMGQATLSRFFVLHVAILSGLLMLVFVMHLVAFRRFGSAGPWKEGQSKKVGYFWPDQAVKDLLVVMVVFLVLVGLCAYWPAPVTGPADHLDNSITPKPEWQFLFLYQFLKLFKGRLEPVGTVGVPLVLTLLLLLLPFYDRSKHRNPFRRPVAMAGGLALVSWLIVCTILGYLSNPGASGATAQVSTRGLSGDVRAGAELFQSQGCISCHAVHGQGGSIGPDLSNIGARGLSRQWLTTQIRDPRQHDPDTVMPSFDSLSDKQVSQLVQYLQSLGGTISQPAASSEGPADQPAEGPPSTSRASQDATGPAREPSSAAQADSAKAGEKLFHDQGCIACHTVQGKGGSIGPDLSDEAAKGRSDPWLATQIRHPRQHDPSTIMPSYDSLKDQQVNQLVAYLQSLEAKPSRQRPSASQPAQRQPSAQPAAQGARSAPFAPPAGQTSSRLEHGPLRPPGRAAYLVGNPPHGKLLYGKYCQTCHGPEGRGGVPNPGSDAGVVPPLNPISAALYSDEPVQFAENIDRLIQHGSVPAGPNPQQTMPAWGDDLKLSQEMISEVEAHVLSLNGVNRAKILRPGVQPGTFFLILLICFGVVLLFGGILWMARAGRPHSGPEEELDTPLPSDGRHRADERAADARSEEQIDEEETPEDIEEEAQAEAEQAEEMRSSPKRVQTFFALIVACTVAIIGAALSLIFSQFVTSKPIPHIPPRGPVRPPAVRPAEQGQTSGSQEPDAGPRPTSGTTAPKDEG